MGLSDNYYRTANAPAQQTAQRMAQTAEQLPQMGAQVDQYRRDNAPISPWEEAAMELQMEHSDPKMVAAKLKQKLAAGAAMPQQPQLNQTGMDGPQMQMAPQVQSTPNGSFYREGGDQNFAAQTPQALGNTHMQQGGKLPFDTSGMTHRDYQDFMGKMGGISKQRQDRDYLEEMKLRNQGNLDVQTKKNEGATEVAKIKRDFDKEKLSSDEMRAELNRRLKEKTLSEREANDVATIQVKWAALRKKVEMFNSIVGNQEKIAALKALESMAGDLENASARVFSSDMAIMGNEDIDSMAKNANEEAKKVREAVKAAVDEMMKTKQAPNGKTGVKVDQPAGMQPPPVAPPANGPKRHSVGETITYKGKTFTVKAVDANGKVTSPTPQELGI